MGPVLTTPRLRLEPLTPAHTEQLLALDADPEVLRFIFGRALSRAEVLARLPKRLAAGLGELGFWMGYAGDDWLGWWCLIPDGDGAAVSASAELGYRLRRSAWGQGYATEGARALLTHAFGTVGLERVWAETMAVNTGSQAVLRKLGLRHERSYVGEWEFPVEGVEHGQVGYAITAGEWPR